MTDVTVLMTVIPETKICMTGVLTKMMMQLHVDDSNVNKTNMQYL